jgi:hypothetical protein
VRGCQRRLDAEQCTLVRLLRLEVAYLDKHKHVGLRYSRDRQQMYGMSDSDWAVKHSTSGHVFKYMTAAISWGSKKQPTVALSSCEAEIMAASEASKEAISLRTLLSDLGFGDDEPTHLHVDNQSAIAVAYNPEHHSRMKHVERRHFFVRECVENLQIVVPFVASTDNEVDFFTKALPAKIFFDMRNKIMNHNPRELVHTPVPCHVASLVDSCGLGPGCSAGPDA